MKPIKGFSNYLVSKEGDVVTKDGKKLSQSMDNLGYLKVTLRKDGKSYSKRVHRLVGETYLKPIEGKTIINHKDGNKTNPHIDNLEYMSNSENTQHGYDNDLYRSRSMLPVIVTGLDGSNEQEYPSIRTLSRELGVNRKTVSSILNDDRINNYGYTFKYKEASETSHIELIKNMKGGNEMSKIAMYKDEIMKEAGWKEDAIDASYTVRDANAKEKIMYGVEAGAKAAKKGAKAGAEALKAGGKIALGTPGGRRATAILVGGTAAGHLIPKIDEKSRNKDTKTRMIRDRVRPDLAMDLKHMPLRTLATGGSFAAGVLAGEGARKLAGKAILRKGGTIDLDKAKKILNNTQTLAMLGTSGATAIAGAEIERKSKQKSAAKRLDKLSEKHLGRKGTAGEHKQIRETYKPLQKKTSTMTPESLVQSKRRAMEKKEMNKKASDYLDEMCKEASFKKKDKLTKTDKKGYIKNVGIGVAQDFMNAGNPLNIGSSIVGSIADAAIVEKASLKMNKKLKAEQVSKDKVDNFNKTVGLKNGTTAINAASKMKK